jgi:hypothetical protein
MMGRFLIPLHKKIAWRMLTCGEWGRYSSYVMCILFVEESKEGWHWARGKEFHFVSSFMCIVYVSFNVNVHCKYRIPTQPKLLSLSVENLLTTPCYFLHHPRLPIIMHTFLLSFQKSLFTYQSKRHFRFPWLFHTHTHSVFTFSLQAIK